MNLSHTGNTGAREEKNKFGTLSAEHFTSALHGVLKLLARYGKCLPESVALTAADSRSAYAPES